MKSLVLRLEGPLQAWATQSKLGVRDTDREPSKSGVLGLLGAALGMERHNEAMLARLRSLSMAVRVDRSGSLLRDYHTAGGGSFRGQANYTVHGTKDCVPSHRYYLQGASFVAALSGEDELIEEGASALANPRWPLFLGRRACPPSAPLLLHTVDGAAEQAVRAAPAAEEIQDERLRLLVEVDSQDEGAEPRQDVPMSFAEGRRRYAVRYVRTEWVRAPIGAAMEQGA